MQRAGYFRDRAFDDVANLVSRGPENGHHDARPFVAADLLDFLANGERISLSVVE